MGKAPAFQFYVGDYLKDTRSLSLSAKGAWSDLLFFMWGAETRGLLSKTWKGYARMLGATVEDTKKAILELMDEKICDVRINNQNVTKRNAVTLCRKKVTLINRRMYREAKELEKTRLRMQRYRERKALKKECYGNVTPLSSSSSLSTKRKEPRSPAKKRLDHGGISEISEKEKIEKMRKKPDERWNAFILAYYDKYKYWPLWAQGRGSKKEFIALDACLKKIIKVGGNKEKFLKCFKMFLADGDKYLEKNGHRPSLLFSCLDGYWQKIEEGTF